MLITCPSYRQKTFIELLGVMEKNNTFEMHDSIEICQMSSRMVAKTSDVHMQAFKGSMNTRIGITYVKKFLDWFLRYEEGIALVAILPNVKSEKIVGYVVGAPLGYGKAMNRELFWVAARNIVIRPWLLLSDQFRSTIKARLIAFFKPPHEHVVQFDLPAPVMSLVGLAVIPDHQGQKIGKELLISFEKQALNLGMRSLRLSVYPENSAARHAYEKCAWVSCESPVEPGKAMMYYKML